MLRKFPYAIEFSIGTGVDLKTFKEAAKILVAGSKTKLNPLVESDCQPSAPSCICGRPLRTGSAVEGARIAALEEELIRLRARRVELIKELRESMEREGQIKKELGPR